MDAGTTVPTFARWFWNQTCTTRTLSPVSAASVSRTWDTRVTEESLSALSLSQGLQEGSHQPGQVHAQLTGHPPVLQAAGHEPFSPYLPAGLGGDLKRCLERPPLLRGQDGPWPLGPFVILPVLSALPRGLAQLADAVLIITFA